MTETAAASLDRIEILTLLPPDARAALVRRCRWRRFGAMEQIFDRSSDSRDVGFIVEGRVRVVNHSLSGREISFDDIDAGGVVGELAAIDGELRSASVVSLAEGTHIAFLGPAAFQELVAGHPPLALAVMRRLAVIVRSSNERIMDLSTLGANNRVHAELLRLARPAARDDNTARIDPIPVHADIAARVSTTRETVARVLNELARDGLVERKGNALIVRDFEELETLVEDVRGVF